MQRMAVIPLPSPAAAMMMVMMMAMSSVEHRAISHSPAAETAEGEDPGAIITIEGACEQPRDKRQYTNEDN